MYLQWEGLLRFRQKITSEKFPVSHLSNELTTIRFRQVFFLQWADSVRCFSVNSDFVLNMQDSEYCCRPRKCHSSPNPLVVSSLERRDAGLYFDVICVGNGANVVFSWLDFVLEFTGRFLTRTAPTQVVFELPRRENIKYVYKEVPTMYDLELVCAQFVLLLLYFLLFH